MDSGMVQLTASSKFCERFLRERHRVFSVGHRYQLVFPTVSSWSARTNHNYSYYTSTYTKLLSSFDRHCRPQFRQSDFQLRTIRDVSKHSVGFSHRRTLLRVWPPVPVFLPARRVASLRPIECCHGPGFSILVATYSQECDLQNITALTVIMKDQLMIFPQRWPMRNS